MEFDFISVRVCIPIYGGWHSHIKSHTVVVPMKATLFSGCRKAADTYEFPVRCGFLNETYAPISDETAVSVASEVSVANLQDEGLWPLMKLVVRKVLAEGASFTKTVYLAGTGLGGSHAALISMWLKTAGWIESGWRTPKGERSRRLYLL